MKNLIIVLLAGLVLLSFGTAGYLIAHWNWRMDLAFQAQLHAEGEARRTTERLNDALESLNEARREASQSFSEKQKMKNDYEAQINKILEREQATQLRASTLQRKVEQLTASNETLQSQVKTLEQRAKDAEAAVRGQQAREKSVNAPVAVMRDGPAPKRMGDF